MQDAAVNRISKEEMLNKAYRLAYFLHQDKGMAIRIVGAATLKLNVAMAVQSKRLYYVPVGRFSRGDSRRTDGIRNKALFSDIHLLQRLIYGESEPYERQKELAATAGPSGVSADGDPASEEDLLVHFIKHLVRITTKRNAFYVTLGVSRLLHSYSTLETMEIYNAVIGEPERVKDDYYYRSRKAVLMHEMYQRFGQLIRACRQRRGEERFETQQGSNEQRSLVGECLRLFTPWDTRCPVPSDFDPFKSVIASLTSNSSADENKIEVNRIHAILHPDCFARLVAAFGYGAPGERMELPRFFSDTNDQSPPQQRRAPAELSAEEVDEINQMLAEQSGRRRRSSSTGVIRIIVDGVERGRLNPAEESSISFTADGDAELIEVKTTDPHGDLLLATHLLTSFEDADEAATVSSIQLEGGQKLSLRISKVESDGGTDLLVKFGYRETNAFRAVSLWWQRLNLRLVPEEVGISAAHIVVAGVVVVCLASYLGYVTLSSRQTSEPAQTLVAQTTPVPVTEAINPPVTEAPRQTAPQPERGARSEVKSARSTAAPKAPAADYTSPDADEDTDVTRSGNVVPNLTLKDVKKIYVGDSQLRSNLLESLGSSGLVATTTNADEADAALKIVISPTSTSAQLVNARGTVLWGRRYSGETSEIVKDLVSEIRLARGAH